MSSLVAWKSSLGLSAILLLASLAGCNRQPASAPPVAAVPQAAPATVVQVPGDMYVDSPPPPPPSEVVVVSPGPDFVWVGGYWGWNSGARIWVRGHWDRPPRPRAEWVQPRWERRGHGYVFIRGYWR